MSPVEYVNASGAAAILGVTRQAVDNAINRGVAPPPDATVSTSRGGRLWLPQTIEKWRAEKQDARPPAPPPHGTYGRYAHHKCRCDECRAANAEVHKHLRAERELRLLKDPTLVPHGRESTYKNWGCRCAECKAAHAKKLHAAYRSRVARLAADPSLRPHGTNATYTGWGCRCEPCAAAAKRYSAERAS